MKEYDRRGPKPGLLIEEARKVIENGGLKIGRESSTVPSYSFEIKESEISTIEFPYEMSGIRWCLTRNRTHEFGKVVVKTRLFKEEYESYPEIFVTKQFRKLEERTGIKKVKDTCFGNIVSIGFKKDVTLSEGDVYSKKTALGNSIQDLMILSRYINLCFQSLLDSEEQRQKEILKTSADELISFAQKYYL